MVEMTPDQWRELVGTQIEQRREERRLSIRAAARLADVSESMWRQIESGRRQIGDTTQTVSPKPATTAAVCRALGWTVDSIDRMLNGGTPADADGGLPPFGPDTLQALDLLAEIAGYVKTTSDRLDSVADRLDRIDARLDELEPPDPSPDPQGDGTTSRGPSKRR